MRQQHQIYILSFNRQMRPDVVSRIGKEYADVQPSMGGRKGYATRTSVITERDYMSLNLSFLHQFVTTP